MRTKVRLDLSHQDVLCGHWLPKQADAELTKQLVGVLGKVALCLYTCSGHYPSSAQLQAVSSLHSRWHCLPIALLRALC